MITTATGLNFILITLVIVASSITIFQTMRDQVTNSKHWIPISLGLIAIAVTVLFLTPTYAGYIAAGAWLLFAIVPSLGFRLSNHLHYRGRYARARQVKQWLRWLHPLPDWPWQEAVFQANIHMYHGERDAAAQVLQRAIETVQATPEREVMIFVLSHDWHGLAAWWESYPDQQRLEERPDVIRHYIRALGEIGRLDEMVALFLHYQSTIERVPLILDYAYLYLFAFGGNVEVTTQLLNNRLGEALNPEAHMLWIATAHGAAQNYEMSKALLHPIVRTTTNGVMRFHVEQRLSRAPLPASEQLSPSAAEQLQKIIRRWVERNQMLALWH